MYPTDNYDMSWDGTFTFQKIKMDKKEKESKARKLSNSMKKSDSIAEAILG